MNPGTIVCPWRARVFVPRPDHRSTWASVPTATMRSPRTASALAQGRVPDAVKILPPTRTRSASPAMEAARPRRVKDFSVTSTARGCGSYKTHLDVAVPTEDGHLMRPRCRDLGLRLGILDA